MYIFIFIYLIISFFFCIQINAVFQFDIRNDKRESQTWYIDYKNGQGSIGIGKPPQSRADLIVAARDDVIIDLASRKITGQKAYMQSKIKVYIYIYIFFFFFLNNMK